MLQQQRHRGHAVIEVADDGLGMTPDRLEHALGEGIGLSNVNERLQTIYGANMVNDKPTSPHRMVGQLKCESYFACAEIDRWASKADVERLNEGTGTDVIAHLLR